jgi:hypothetical protein
MNGNYTVPTPNMEAVKSITPTDFCKRQASCFECKGKPECKGYANFFNWKHKNGMKGI